MSEQQGFAVAQRVGQVLMRVGSGLVTAESCTGGMVASLITSVPGSSQWFDRGFVTYTNLSKQEMLGVRQDTIEQYGAVSEQTVREMVRGALQHSHARVALAISGIAGPGGGSAEKPVGTVWLAWADANVITARKAFYTGDREQIREQAVIEALQGVIDLVDADG